MGRRQRRAPGGEHDLPRRQDHADGGRDAIFWGPSWSNALAGDKISGIDTWYTGFSGLELRRRPSDEYTGTATAATRSDSGDVLRGSLVDTVDGSGGGQHVGDPRRGRKEITGPRSPTATTRCTPTCRAAGRATARGTRPAPVGGVTVQFAFFFRLDGDAGCDPARHLGPAQPGLGRAGATCRPTSSPRPAPIPATRTRGTTSGRRERRQVRVDVRRAAR